MSRKIKIYSKAFQDIETGVAYYQLQQKGLGKKFEHDLHSAFRKIQKYPFAASLAYETVRYKTIERFPYIILYEFDDANIYILRIFNTHQKPVY